MVDREDHERDLKLPQDEETAELLQQQNAEAPAEQVSGSIQEPTDRGQDESVAETIAAPVPTVTEEEAESALSRAYHQYQKSDEGETFTEIIVPYKKRSIDYLKMLGLVLAYILLMMLAMQFLPPIFPIVLLGGAYLLWWLISGLNKEFEYVVTKGDLDIDMIIARRKRKRVFSVKAKDIEIMAAVKSDDYATYAKQNVQTLDFSTDLKSEKNWFIIAQYKQQRTMALLNGDERVVRNIHRHAPSKVRYNRMVGL